MTIPNDGGRYEDECTYVRERTGARGVLLIVFKDAMHGFSVQCDPDTMVALPDILEMVASDIRRQLGPMGPPPGRDEARVVRSIIELLPDDKADGLRVLDAARAMVERFKR